MKTHVTEYGTEYLLEPGDRVIAPLGEHRYLEVSLHPHNVRALQIRACPNPLRVCPEVSNVVRIEEYQP